MPQLSKVIENREKKKFTKKSYRPWDLTGTDNKKPETKDMAVPDKKEEAAQAEIDNTLDNKDNNLDNNIVNELENNKVTIRKQLDNVLDNDITANSLSNQIKKLSGIQGKILNFIADICISQDALETGAIETNLLVQCSGSTHNSVKTSIHRLIEKGLITRKKGKTARGGYINLSLPSDVKSTILKLREERKMNFDSSHQIHSVKTALDNRMDNEKLYSISSNINTTTNSKIALSKSLPKEWKEINSSLLTDIGFTKNQLLQLYQTGHCTPEVVQLSINHFAYGLAHNEKVKNYPNPLNVLMGVLRKGQTWIEQNYRSPQEIAQEQLLQQRKAEKERVKQLQEDAYKLALADWLETLSEEEKLAIAPAKKAGQIAIPQSVKLSLYFKENVWPEKKAKYLIHPK